MRIKSVRIYWWGKKTRDRRWHINTETGAVSRYLHSYIYTIVLMQLAKPLQFCDPLVSQSDGGCPKRLVLVPALLQMNPWPSFPSTRLHPGGSGWSTSPHQWGKHANSLIWINTFIWQSEWFIVKNEPFLFWLKWCIIIYFVLQCWFFCSLFHLITSLHSQRCTRTY